MVDLGTLEIGLKLDKASVERDIKDIRKELESLYELTDSNNIAIKPKVNHEPLTALNKHLDKKVKHLKEVKNYFNSNPIKVAYEEDETGSKKKKRGNRGGSPQGSQENEKNNNWETKLANALEQAFNKSISTGVNALLDGLPGPIRSIVANPLVGFIQGAMFSTADRTIQTMLYSIKQHTARQKGQTTAPPRPDAEWLGRNVLTGELIMPNVKRQGTSSQSVNQTVPDPWDENDPLPTVEVVGRGQDSSQEKKQRTVVVEEVQDDKSKPAITPGYSVKGDGTVSNVSTQNTFKALATEIRKLNSRIVPAPVQTLTHGLQGGEVGNLTSAIVALQASIDSLNDRFAQFSGGGEVTGGLSVIPNNSSEIISIDDLIDPSPIQMTAQVIGNVTGGIQKLGNVIQGVGTVTGKVIGPLFRALRAMEEISLLAIPGGHVIKNTLQGAGTLGLGMAGMHYLPGGGAFMVEGMQTLLNPVATSGASALTGVVADVVGGLPMIGPQITAAIGGALAGGADVAATVAAQVATAAVVGNSIVQTAKFPFNPAIKDKVFAPNPITIGPAGEPIAQIKGRNNKSLSGGSPSQPSLPSSGSTAQGTMNVKQLNAGEIKGTQLALPSKSGGVNYDVHGLDNIKSELDLVDYLSVENKIKNNQGKNIQVFEADGLKRLAKDLASLNKDTLKDKINRSQAVDYITKQDLTQVMGLLAQNPSRYYNPKASVPTQVVNPNAEAIKQPDNQKEIVAKVKGGAKEVTGQFNSAKNLAELEQALISYQKYVKGISALRVQLTPTRDLNGVLNGLKTSIEKSVVEVAKGIDQGLGQKVGLDTAIGVLQRETPELANAVKAILKMSSPSKVFMQIGGFVSEGLEKGIDFSKAKQKIARQSIDLINTAKNVLKISSPAETFAYIGQMIVLGLEKGLTFDEIKATIPQEVRSIIKDIDTIINDVDASRLQGVKKSDLIGNAKTKLLSSFNANAVNPDVSLQKIAEQILAFRHNTSAQGLELLLQGSRVPGANGVPGLLRPTERAFAQRQGFNVQDKKLNQAGVMPPVHNAIVLQNTPNMAGSAWSYGNVGIQFKKNQQGWISQAMGDSGLGTQINQMPFTKSGSIDFDKLLEMTLKNLQYEGKKEFTGGQSYLESHWWGEQNPSIESLYLANEKGRFTHKGSSGADELQKAYKAAAQAVRQGIPAFYEFLPKSKTGDWGDWGNNATPQWQQLSAEAFDLLGGGMSYDDMIAKLGKNAFGNLQIPDNDTATKPVAQKIVKKVTDEVRKNVAQTPPPDASYKVTTPAVNQVKPQQKDFVSVHSGTTAQPTPQTINASSRRRKRGSTVPVQQPVATMDNYDPWLDVDAVVDDFEPVLPDSSYVDKRRKRRGYSSLPYTPEPEEKPIRGRRNRGFSGGGALALYSEPVNYINPSSNRFGRRRRGYRQQDEVENNRFGRRRRGYSQENYETELDNEIPIGERRRVRSSRGMRDVEPTGQYRFVSPDDLWYDGQEEEIPAPDASYIHQIQARRKKTVRGVVTRKQRTPKTVVTPSKYSGYSFSPRVEMPTPIPFDFSTHTPYTPPVQSVKQDIKQESENVSKFNNLKQPFMEAVKARDYDSVINMLKTLGGNNKNVLGLEKFLGDSGLLKSSKNIGKNVATSVGTGVTQSLGDVKSAGEKIGKTLDNSTKAVLGIASPSKVFMQIGKDIVNGLETGFFGSFANFNDRMKRAFIQFATESAKYSQVGAIGNFPDKNLYGVLGVSPSASKKEIKSAYLQLAKQNHPDVNPSQEAKRLMQMINEAYEVLKDESSRQEYDKFLSATTVKRPSPSPRQPQGTPWKPTRPANRQPVDDYRAKREREEEARRQAEQRRKRSAQDAWDEQYRRQQQMDEVTRRASQANQARQEQEANQTNVSRRHFQEPGFDATNRRNNDNENLRNEQAERDKRYSRLSDEDRAYYEEHGDFPVNKPRPIQAGQNVARLLTDLKAPESPIQAGTQVVQLLKDLKAKQAPITAGQNVAKLLTDLKPPIQPIQAGTEVTKLLTDLKAIQAQVKQKEIEVIPLPDASYQSEPVNDSSVVTPSKGIGLMAHVGKKFATMDRVLNESIGKLDFDKAIKILKVLSQLDDKYAVQLKQIETERQKIASQSSSSLSTLPHSTETNFDASYTSPPVPSPKTIEAGAVVTQLLTGLKQVVATVKTVNVSSSPQKRNRGVIPTSPMSSYQGEPDWWQVLDTQPVVSTTVTPPPTKPVPLLPPAPTASYQLPVTPLPVPIRQKQTVGTISTNINQDPQINQVKQLQQALKSAFDAKNIRQAITILAELAQLDNKYVTDLRKLQDEYARRLNNQRKNSQKQSTALVPFVRYNTISEDDINADIERLMATGSQPSSARSIPRVPTTGGGDDPWSPLALPEPKPFQSEQVADPWNVLRLSPSSVNVLPLPPKRVPNSARQQGHANPFVDPWALPVQPIPFNAFGTQPKPLPNASYTPPPFNPNRRPFQSISSDTFNTDPYAVYDNNIQGVALPSNESIAQASINNEIKRLNNALVQAFASGDIEEAARILRQLSHHDEKYLLELQKLQSIQQRRLRQLQLENAFPEPQKPHGRRKRSSAVNSAFHTRATMATGTEQRIDPVTGLPYNVTTRGRRTNQTQAIDSGDRVLTTPVSESALSEQFELALERGNLDEAKQLGEQLLSLDSRYVAKYKELEQALNVGDVDKITKIIKEIAQLDNKYLTKVKEIEKAQQLRNAQTQNASFVVPPPSANPNRPVDTVMVNGSGGGSQPPNTPTASYADDGNQARNFFNRLWNRLTGNIPPRSPVTPPPTETSGGDVPLDSSLTVIPNNVRQGGDEPFVPFGGSKKFSIANLNTGGGIKSSDTDSLMAQARRLGRDLTRAMNLGLEDNGGFQAKIRYQVEQVKAQIQRLKELEVQLQATTGRIQALNFRQESRGQRQEALQGEIKALQESLPNTPVGDRDKVKAQIASKEKELLGVINEEKKVADKLLAEKKKEQDLQTVINRERQEIFDKEKTIRESLDNEIAQDSAVFREMEDQKNRAGVEQVVRKVKSGIPDTDINGNPQNKDEFIGQVAGFGASAAIAFAPITGLLTLAPVVAKLLPTITALTGAFNMIAPIFRNVAQNIEKLSSLQNRFNAVSTDPTVKGKEFDYVKGVSNKLGISSQVASEQYTKLYTAARGTKLQGAELKQLFEGVAASVRTLNLTTYESELVFNAYAQILSKGKLSMEELRQQLGEKFPPAMGVFARSLGVSVAELDALTSKGAILSDDVLSKVGKQLKIEYEPIVGNIGDSYTASLNRFKNAVMDLNVKLVNEFEGLFIALNNVMAFGIRTVDNSFDSLKQFFLTSVIGVTAVLAVGSTVIMNIPFIEKYVSGFMSLFTQSLNRGMTALMPFAAGIGVDLLPFLFGSDMRPMDHMTHGIWNMVEAMVSLGQVKPDTENPLGGFMSGIVDMAKKVGKALNDLRKWLSGPIQLVGLVLMFEQMIVLGNMYVVPTLMNIGTSIGNLAQTMWKGLSSGKNWMAMLREIAPVALASKVAVLALEAGLALLLMSFARGQLANPLQDSFVKLKASANDLWKALEPLTQLKINPEVNIPKISGFPEMGIETNFWAMVGQKDKSVLSDEVISKAAPVSATESALSNNEFLKFAEGWGTLGIGKLVNFTSSALTAMVGNETDKARFYNYLGVGGGEIQQSQRDALEKRGLGEHLPANNRETYGLRTTVNQFQFIETLQQELNNQVKAYRLDRENIAEAIKIMEGNISDITTEQAKPILRDSGLSEDKQKEILDIKTIEGLDDRRKALGAKRADLAVINTPEALEEIRAIDMELRAIEGIRKNVVIEVSTMVDGLDSQKKIRENFMESIDELMVTPDIKIQMKKEIQRQIDEIDRIKQAFADAGLYDKLKPLENVFKRITTEILRMDNAFQKFLITGGEKVAQKRINLLESGIAPEALPIEMSNINLQWDTEKLTDLNARLTKAQTLFKELSAIAIPAEGDPRSEQKKNLQEQIKQMRNERMELATSIAQQRYDINQNAIRRTIALRNFDRSVVDLQIQVDSAIRQRAVEIRNIVRQQDDLVTQNTIAVRNIYQSYRDLQIQLERRSIELNSQLEQSRNNIDRLIFNINTNQLVGYGSGLGSRLATISERLSQINADFANATENLKLQELDAEQQSLQITRQIRDLREQAHTIELQRRRQLQDLATTQETFVRNQANTWMQIQRRTEDMKDEADRMGTNFTTMGKTIGDMNDLYLDIHDNLKETADKINSRPITIDEIGVKGTASTVPSYPKLPSVITQPPVSTSPTINIANGSSLTLPNGVKPVIQNSTLNIPMGTVLTQNGARYSIPSNATLNFPQGVTPNINGATVNIPQGTTMTLPPNKALTPIPSTPPSNRPITVMPKAGKSVTTLANHRELNDYFDNHKQRILANQGMFTLSPSRWDLSNVPTPANVKPKERDKATDLLNTLNSEIGQGLIFVADDMGNILGLQIKEDLVRLLTGDRGFKGERMSPLPSNSGMFQEVMTKIKEALKIEATTISNPRTQSFNHLKNEFDEAMATMVGINKQFNKTEKLLANNSIKGLNFGVDLIANELAQRLPTVPVIRKVDQTQTKPNPKVMELFNNPADSTPITPNSTGEMGDIEKKVPTINQEEIKETSAKLKSRNATLVNIQRILVNSRENEELYKWIKELQNLAKEYNRLGQEIQDKAIAHVRQMKRFNMTLEEVKANMLGFVPMYLEPELARMRKEQEIDDKINAIEDNLLKMRREFDTSTVNLLEEYRSQLAKILEGSEDLVGDLFATISDPMELVEKAIDRIQAQLKATTNPLQIKKLNVRLATLVESRNAIAELIQYNNQISEEGKDYVNLQNQVQFYKENRDVMVGKAGQQSEVATRQKVTGEMSKIYDLLGNAFSQDPTSEFYDTANVAFKNAKFITLRAEREQLLNEDNFNALFDTYSKYYGTDDRDVMKELIKKAFDSRDKKIRFDHSGYNEMKTEFGQLADMMNSIGGQLNQRGNLLRGNSLTSNGQSLQAKIQANDMRVNLLRLKDTTKLTDEQFKSLGNAVNDFEKNALAKIAVDNNIIVAGLVDPMKTAISGFATIFIDKSKSFWEKVNDIMTNFFTGIANHFANNFSTAVTTWITEKLAQWINWGVNTGTEALDIATATALNSAGIKLDASTFMLDEASRSQTLAAWELAQAAAKLNASLGAGQEKQSSGSGILNSVLGAFMQPIASLGFGSIVPDTGALSDGLATPAVTDFAFTDAVKPYSIADDVKIKGWGNYAKGGLVDIENFAKGGLVNIENFAKGGLVEQAQKALAKERMLGGGKAVLSALTVGEYVVPKNPDRKDIANLFASVPMARDMQIENYAKGGMVGKASSLGGMTTNNSRIETRDNSFVSNIYVNANDAGSFRKTRYQLEMEENARIARASRRF